MQSRRVGCGTRGARVRPVTAAAKLPEMHAVIVGEVPGFDEWLEERRKLGQDRRDEVWDGVLHVVPPTTTRHQVFETDLELVLRPIVRELNLLVAHVVGVFFESGLERGNYRSPDIVVAN